MDNVRLNKNAEYAKNTIVDIVDELIAEVEAKEAEIEKLKAEIYSLESQLESALQKD